MRKRESAYKEIEEDIHVLIASAVLEKLLPFHV